jgi:hypothetical protein
VVKQKVKAGKVATKGKAKAISAKKAAVKKKSAKKKRRSDKIGDGGGPPDTEPINAE